MTTKTIIISLIIVVAICVVVFEYFHKKHTKYTEDELKQFTNRTLFCAKRSGEHRL